MKMPSNATLVSIPEISQLWYYVTAFMMIDIFLGMYLAATKGAIDAETSFKGICKKGGILLVLIFTLLLENLSRVPLFKITALFYMVYEAVSIVENAGLLGIPLPNAVKNAIEALKKTSDGQ
jgi:toxin secretion/phage lysis holin